MYMMRNEEQNLTSIETISAVEKRKKQTVKKH